MGSLGAPRQALSRTISARRSQPRGAGSGAASGGARRHEHRERAAAAPERADGAVRRRVERHEVENHQIVGPAERDGGGQVVEVAGGVADQAFAPQPGEQAIGGGGCGKHQDPHRHTSPA